MPRKAPDSVGETRLTLGTFERQLATESLRTAQAGVLSQTLVGIAAGAGGIGILVGSLAFAAWKAPGVIGETGEKVVSLAEDVLGINIGKDADGGFKVTAGVGGLAGVGGVLDAVVNASSDGLVSLRREGQALAQERGAIVREINAFCSINGDKYDAVKCNAAHERREAYFNRLKDFRARVAAWSKATGKDDSSVYGGGGSAFGSLGDIDPNYA